MIKATGRASVGKLGTTTKIKENVKAIVGIHSVPCDTAVYVRGRVGGHPVDILVDTGSAVTLVHCPVLERAKIDIKLGMVSEPVVSANGQPLDIKCELEIFPRGVSVVHPVLVAADVTLGIDFLGRHNCRIDLKGKSIKIGKEVLSLKGKNKSSKVFPISLAEPVVVPGRHEMTLPAKFKGAVWDS